VKCVHCGKDSNFKERRASSAHSKCPACGTRFAFEPKDKDPFTDAAFKAAIDAVSASGQIRWGIEHLYYELCRRAWKRTLPWRNFVFAAIVGSVIVFAVFRMAFLIPILFLAWLVTWLLLRRHGRPATVVLDQTDFNRLWNKWLAVHGSPDGLIVRKPQKAPTRAQEPDIGDYSFDRAVICDRARTVDLLLANNFHFENNCAVLSIGGYPEGPFDVVRTMLKRNPKLQVFALHDASMAGCQLAYQLANDERWFKGLVPVTDVGLRPRHADPFRGLWQAATGVLPVAAGSAVSADELQWLNEHVLELAAIRPEQVLKRLFRAINRREEISDSAGGDGGSIGNGGSSTGNGGTVHEDRDSFSADAGDSDGGADSFG
jgi:DNA-directed RNA polymerase subunit RPC12/RpoP